jgi:phosphohistidine swiveling domain-containing protein
MMTDTNVRIVDVAADGDGGLTIGGKAAGLAKLARAGLPVPRAVAVPAEALDIDIDDLAAEIADRFPESRLAIRSSGVAEDLEQASFAGQYETVLNVESIPRDIASAIRHVRSSATGAGVASYAGRHATGMAVLVMPMVDADVAGIAFTRDPVTGERVVVVEAVRGLGDRLASGEQTGERWRIGTSAERLNDLGVLTEGRARSIAELAERCESIVGSAQDIEWAIDGDAVVLLQARPITTVDDVEPIPMNDEAPPGPWEWDSTHNQLPVTPLTASMFTEALERGSRNLAATYGAPIKQLSMRAINGYLYIQVVPPAGKAGSPSPPKPVMRALFRVSPSLRRRTKAARQALEQRTDQRLVQQWHNEIRPKVESTLGRWLDLDPAGLTNDQLAERFVETIELQRDTFDWNMVTDPAYLFPLSDLHDFVVAELGGGMETTTRLLAGASPSDYRASLVSLAHQLSPATAAAVVDGTATTAAELSAIDPGFAAAYESHLRAFGLRILGFDLSAKVLLEDPALELSRLATLPASDDPSVAAEELAAALRSSLEAEKAARFDDLITEARDAYPIREGGEAVHAKTMGAVRLTALEAGRRMVDAGQISDPNHAIFLTAKEIVGWLRAPSDISQLVDIRRGQHAWAKGHSPAPFLGDHSPMPDADIFPEEVQRIMKALALVITHDARPAALADGVDGVAASPGVHTGPVRIVTGPDEFHKAQPGDVLVAPITTSPWEVLFPHIGGLVTEGGGLLSHPAIVAREYGLPAVVGCADAMSRFHDGQLVVVDGAAGTVTPVEAT